MTEGIDRIREIKRQLNQELTPYTFERGSEENLRLLTETFRNMKVIRTTARVEGDSIYIDDQVQGEYIPFILDIESDRVYNLFYNGSEECRGKIYFVKIIEESKVGWKGYYFPNVPLSYIKVDFTLNN